MKNKELGKVKIASLLKSENNQKESHKVRFKKE